MPRTERADEPGHSAAGKSSAGPVGALESRTASIRHLGWAVSTQLLVPQLYPPRAALEWGRAARAVTALA